VLPCSTMAISGDRLALAGGQRKPGIRKVSFGYGRRAKDLIENFSPDPFQRGHPDRACRGDGSGQEHLGELLLRLYEVDQGEICGWLARS